MHTFYCNMALTPSPPPPYLHTHRLSPRTMTLRKDTMMPPHLSVSEIYPTKNSSGNDLKIFDQPQSPTVVTLNQLGFSRLLEPHCSDAPQGPVYGHHNLGEMESGQQPGFSFLKVDWVATSPAHGWKDCQRLPVFSLFDNALLKSTFHGLLTRDCIFYLSRHLKAMEVSP